MYIQVCILKVHPHSNRSMTTTTQIIFPTSAGCECANCKAHRFKTDNCQCFNCNYHRSTVGGVSNVQPLTTDVIVDNKQEKNSHTTLWIIVLVIIFILLIVVIFAYAGSGTTSSFNYGGYYNKEIITESVSANGTKTTYVYKNSDGGGGGWGWLIFWIFIFFLIFSPTYYYVK